MPPVCLQCIAVTTHKHWSVNKAICKIKQSQVLPKCRQYKSMQYVDSYKNTTQRACILYNSSDNLVPNSMTLCMCVLTLYTLNLRNNLENFNFLDGL